MSLKEGNLDALTASGLIKKDISCLSDTLFHQMLQALNCLAHNSILHWDVKPNNILYTNLHNEEYLFQLTDFGLFNLIIITTTYAESSQFMTSEVLLNSETQQTSKIDMWSLFVTMTYALNAGSYYQWSLCTVDDTVKATLAAMKSPTVNSIKEIAIVNPDK